MAGGISTPASIWALFSPVERTCLQTCYYRWRGSQLVTDADGNLCYTDQFAEKIAMAVLPVDAQEEMLTTPQGDWMLRMMSVRTATIDKSLLDIATSHPNQSLQIVLLGAGMDTRAWRLELPMKDIQWYEVDTSTVHNLKQQLLGDTPTKYIRHSIIADISNTAELDQQLKQAGFTPITPTIWLMEGFLGYITAEQQVQLASHLHRLSAPGSYIIASGPPDAATRQECLSLGMQLHHSNFDAVEVVAGRFEAAGWRVLQIKRRQQLQQEYGIRQCLDLMVMVV